MTDLKRIEMLESGKRRMNEFLAMLAHELRNPLAPIRNALELMRDGAAGDTTRDRLRDVIDRQVSQLTRLVDDLLDVGRITSGKIVLRKEPVDLNTIVSTAVESCRAIADAHRQSLVARCSSEAVTIDGDPARLSQIVLNLVNNAIKYTPDGGRIETSVSRDGDWALIRVKDSGIGISAELLPKVFDLFVQGERSLDRTEGGLGIGLTIVRQLVALHRGTVVARSEGTNRGSEFDVLLPAPSGMAVAQRPSVPEPPVEAGVKRRVLVVDDNRDAADMLAALMSLWGHDVRSAYDGASALAAAADFLPDVALLDIGLPEMSGYELAGKLRESRYPESIVLIAFTGYGQDEDRRRVREAGFDHHLVKPVEPVALQRLIDSIPVPAATRPAD